MTAALKKRKELIVEAQRRKKEVEERIVTLGTEITAQELKVKNLETELAEAERKDRGKIVRGAGKAGKIGVLVGLAKERIDELRSALSEVRSQRDAALTRIKELEGILSQFKTEYNPNFNDEGVKRAVRAWDDYAAVDRSEQATDTEFESDIDDILKPDSESEGINFAEFEAPDEDDLDLRKLKLLFAK
jgi:protein kinase C substrate 80K-H